MSSLYQIWSPFGQIKLTISSFVLKMRFSGTVKCKIFCHFQPKKHFHFFLHQAIDIIDALKKSNGTKVSNETLLLLEATLMEYMCGTRSANLGKSNFVFFTDSLMLLKSGTGTPKWWSLQAGGRQLRFDCILQT